ncbi:MAG: ABC transporter substrate-binding protein [Lentisphaeria bacterium]|nr:ABC transporter substrate-binding protein [Lentisphaeria bacterium]
MLRARVRRWGVACVCTLVLLVAGCGKRQVEEGGAEEGIAPGASDKPTIYFIVKASESEFWQIVIDGGKTAAAELGVDLVPQAPVSESEFSKQIAIMESAIAARPAAIVLAPSASDPLVASIEQAHAADIPVVIIDSAANTDKIVSFLASDNRRIGELSADSMAAALTRRFGEAKGDIAALTFLSGAQSLDHRKEGFLERLRSTYPGIRVVDFKDAQGKSDTSTALVQNLLTAYPNLRGIYANNQPTGDGTVRALDMAGKKGLAVVVVDAGQQEQWGLENGLVDAMIVQKPWHMGYMGVEYALKAVKGEKLPAFIDTGIVAITPEMMASGAAEEFLDPVAWRRRQAPK